MSSKHRKTREALNRWLNSRIEHGVALIPLFDGATAIVDERDHALASYVWHRDSEGYVFRTESSGRRRRPRTVYLHRELLGLHRGDGLHGDHINFDVLDNRRSNLRALTRAEHRQRHRVERSARAV